MKTTLKILLVMVTGFALTMGTGYAGEQMPKAGFLSDYSKLKKDPGKKLDWIYWNEKANIGAYNRIMLEEVTFFLKEDAKYKGIKADEMKELSDTLTEALVEALSESYSFASKPGPGVMRLRIALTNLVPGEPMTGTVTSVIPVGIAISSVKKAATGSHVGMGEAAFEAELLDSQTGEQLAATVDAKTGAKYRVDKSLSKWGQVKQVFSFWAEDLKNRLDERSGRK